MLWAEQTQQIQYQNGKEIRLGHNPLSKLRKATIIIGGATIIKMLLT